MLYNHGRTDVGTEHVADRIPAMSEIDIALMNILQKVARLATNQTHLDSIVDIAGYAATIERIVRKV